MERQMIIRHITNKNSLKAIIKHGSLDSKFNKRTHDKDHISFQFNPANDFLTQHFHLLKDWNASDTFELNFDGNRLLNAGYKIHDNIEGNRFNKETDIGWRLKEHNITFSDDEVNNVEYCFIKYNVPLYYLTEESKEEVNKFLKEEDYEKNYRQK
ncbi:hypothetical protein [Staphylococcus xylosus]|uniref:hypothetical protein n=1 Tax=Staphylococcus xylosus TaxID=1288 RepID=UPI0031BABD4C